MLKQIKKTTTVKGTSVYPMHDGVADAFPAAIDATCTLPSFEFESTDVSGVMGTMTVNDTTRVGNMDVVVNCNTDDENAQRLYGDGVVGWKICKAVETLDPNGELALLGIYYYCTGYVSGPVESSAEVGGDGKGDITMHILSIRKVDSNGKVYYNMHRTAGKLVIGGKDYRKELDALL